MKKLLSIILIVCSGPMLAQPTINLPASTVCVGSAAFNASLSSLVPGATGYSWSVAGSNCSGQITQNYSLATVTPSCPGIYSVVCAAYNGLNNPPTLITTLFATLAINPAPVIAVAGPNTICPNSPTTFTPSGAQTYTYFPSAGMISPGVFSFSASTCFTVSGTSGGCTGSAVKCVSVMPGFINTNSPSVCAGDTTSLYAFGAQNYTWTPGGFSGPSVLMTPTANACYTVMGTTSAGCIAWAVACITVLNPPVVNISGASSGCAGSNVLLSASGANTYTWSVGSTLAQVNVSLNAPACYSVIGTGINGCKSMAVKCLSVTPGPVLSVSGPTMVCLGTSALLTASGATNFTWNVGPVTSTLSVSPTITTNYSLTGNSGGCSSALVHTLFVNPNCSDVWPGDANSDGTVSTLDVLELGLQANSTGAARTPGGINYTAQNATNWAGTISTGKNRCHADCNGDGVVNSGDTLAIFNNFSLNHSFKPSGASAGDLNLVSATGKFEAGRWNSVDVVAGDATAQQSQLLGLGFEISFDQSLIVPDSIYIIYSSSFINAGNTNIQFQKTFFNSGKLYSATVRTNQTNVTGFGKIAEVRFKVKDQVNAGTQLNLGVNGVQRINNAGAVNTLNGATSILNIEMNPTGLATAGIKQTFALYPNPAREIVTLYSNNTEKASVRVTDLSGRELFSGTMQGNISLDTRSYQNGVYIITVRTEEVNRCMKLVIEK